MADLKLFQKLTLVTFCVLTDVSFVTVIAARECCPPNSYLVKGTKLCSDNKTFINLTCPTGSIFLDHILNDDEKVVATEDVSVFEEGSVPKDKFCTAKIQRNGTDRLVALVCFEEVGGNWVEIVLRIMMLISTLFLLATLYVYLALPNLKDLQGKCVIAFICCLISSYIVLLLAQTFPSFSDLGCALQAAALYFCTTATFFWNNIITFNIWRAIRNASHKIRQKSLSVIYLLWGFGVPILMVAISFILDNVPGENHIRPHFGEIKCWFRGNAETWSYFYGPVSVLLFLNTIMFLHSVWLLWKIYKVSNIPKIKSLRFKCMMYLKLFLLMGITWTFEVISFAITSGGNMKYVWFVTDCLNSAQGVLIFLILIVFRQKIRMGILKHKLLNINWPQSWSREEIQESSTASLAEEFELPNQKSKMIVESQK